MDTHYVYIVECADKTLYVGCTNDIKRRIYRHNHSKSGAKYTRIRRPVVLMYQEKYPTLGEALTREHDIKKMKRENKIKLIETNPVNKADIEETQE
jgi:putative endonuclease